MPRFSKYSGAGNDFILIRAEEPGLGDPAALAARLCPRETGVGVDGLITVGDPADGLPAEGIRLRFFNRDGSEFSTCGNGSRCAARFVVDRGLAAAEHVLVTDDGEIRARVEDDRVSLEYGLDAQVEREVRVLVEAEERDAWLVRMGTPHLVVPMPSVEVEEFDAVCRPLRHREDLGPDGANVHLVAREAGVTHLRTFERGVEAETLACGSGCMAVAFALRAAGEVGERTELVTRSGAVLGVAFLPDGRIRLTGPAAFIFDGTVPAAMP